MYTFEKPLKRSLALLLTVGLGMTGLSGSAAAGPSAGAEKYEQPASESAAPVDFGRLPENPLILVLSREGAQVVLNGCLETKADNKRQLKIVGVDYIEGHIMGSVQITEDEEGYKPLPNITSAALKRQADRNPNTLTTGTRHINNFDIQCGTIPDAAHMPTVTDLEGRPANWDDLPLHSVLAFTNGGEDYLLLPDA